MTHPRRPQPLILLIRREGDVALLRAGGNATIAHVISLAEYVLLEPRYSPTHRSWVVPIGGVDDLYAGAQILHTSARPQHWVIHERS